VTVSCGASLYGAEDRASPPLVKIVQCAAWPFQEAGSAASSHMRPFLRARRYERSGTEACAGRHADEPPLISLWVPLLKSLRGSRQLYWEMDVYPDIW